MGNDLRSMPIRTDEAWRRWAAATATALVASSFVIQALAQVAAPPSAAGAPRMGTTAPPVEAAAPAQVASPGPAPEPATEGTLAQIAPPEQSPKPAAGATPS